MRLIGAGLDVQVQSGLIEYVRLNGSETDRKPQLYIYDECLRRFGSRHRWMGFMDADECALPACNAVRDQPVPAARAWTQHIVHGLTRLPEPFSIVVVSLEGRSQQHRRCCRFLVLRDHRIGELPSLLQEYESYGALVVNWQVRAVLSLPCSPAAHQTDFHACQTLRYNGTCCLQQGLLLTASAARRCLGPRI